MWLACFRILDEETAGAFADPLHDAWIFCAAQESFNAVERIGCTAAAAFVGFCPFVNHRKGESEFGRNLLGTGLLHDFPEKFV